MTDMNKQQGPLNPLFTPNAQSKGKDGEPALVNETKTIVSQPRLRHKTKLYGMSQNEAAKQITQSSSKQTHTSLNNPDHTLDSTFSATALPFNPNIQKSSTEPSEAGSTSFNPSRISRGNTQQLNPINGSGNTGQFNPINGSGNTGQFNPINGSGKTGQFNPINGSGKTGQFGAVTRQLGNPTGTLLNPNNTGTLMHPAGEYSGDTGMLKLNQAVKVVRIPVAGKPGEFKTGILPVLAQNTTGTMPPLSKNSWQEKIKQNSKLILLGSLILLILFASSIYLLSRGSTTPQVASNNTHPTSQTQNNLNTTATANIQATATFTASLIVSDNLSYNARGWSTQSEKGIHRNFTGNAYHIRSDTSSYFAPSILWNEVPPTKYTYSLDMQEVAGDNTSQFNYYGLLLNYQQDKNNNPTFYLFCIVNEKSGSQYQFVRFDNKTATKWSNSVWKKNTGKEFHSGKTKSTLMVQVDGSHFTFWANGVKLGTTQDKTFGSGSIGMGVNGVLGGAEVAFTNLILAQN